MRQLRRSVRRLLGSVPLTVVFGAMADKDLVRALAELRRLAPEQVVFTAAAGAGPRALPPPALAAAWSGPSRQALPATDALALARELAGGEGWVLVCGSLYLVGELRAALTSA
jgi:dihydrofolate synthase/folylpolyglutamate synthase